MAGSRNFRRRRGASGTRARVSWQNIGFAFTLGTLGVLVVADLTPEVLTLEDHDGTATAKRMIISFQATQITEIANVPQEFGFGIMVQTRAAFDALTFTRPLSGSQQGQDWYYWTARNTFRESADVNPHTNWEVDIQTMRKLRSGYSLVMVAEPVVANTSVINLQISTRVLWSVQVG